MSSTVISRHGEIQKASVAVFKGILVCSWKIARATKSTKELMLQGVALHRRLN